MVLKVIPCHAYFEPDSTDASVVFIESLMYNGDRVKNESDVAKNVVTTVKSLKVCEKTK